MPNLSRRAQLRALVEEEVGRAMAPYRQLGLSADVLDELERLLRFALDTHATPQRLFRLLLDEAVLAESDEVDTGAIEGVEEHVKKDQGA